MYILNSSHRLQNELMLIQRYTLHLCTAVVDNLQYGKVTNINPFSANGILWFAGSHKLHCRPVIRLRRDHPTPLDPLAKFNY